MSSLDDRWVCKGCGAMRGAEKKRCPHCGRARDSAVTTLAELGSRTCRSCGNLCVPVADLCETCYARLDKARDAEQDVGRKDDQGKAPWHLLPFDAIGAILRVLAFGAKKYAPRNWEKGMDWDRPYDACLRHLTDWHQRENADPETGFSHLWHAGCCILFLIAYEIRKIGKDTRPGVDKL